MTPQDDWLGRTELLLGSEKLDTLRKSHVLVIGLGGVGSAAAEMLCRAGVGRLTLADADVVEPSNRNRQLIALLSTQGQRKTEALAQRLSDINPQVELELVDAYLKEDSMIALLENPYDYIVDAIATLSPKAYMLLNAVRLQHKIVSAMGAGAKLDVTKVRIADISETHTCTFAFDIRKRLRKLGVASGFKAVFSIEPPQKSAVVHNEAGINKKSIAGTISYMPVLFGCYCASVVIQDLIEDAKETKLP
ncbi:MAG: tRNA threonylcarbamoyladenosine dehydratase [Bacillota bacterium]